MNNSWNSFDERTPLDGSVIELTEKDEIDIWDDIHCFTTLAYWYNGSICDKALYAVNGKFYPHEFYHTANNYSNLLWRYPANNLKTE